MISRRVALLAAGSRVLGGAATRRRPPNVVRILADDLGFGDPGCFGGEIPAPNLDRLAAGGLRFTSAYIAAPICSPSRVRITTGQFPARHGIFSYLDSREHHRAISMRDWLDPRAPSIARVLRHRALRQVAHGRRARYWRRAATVRVRVQ
ncbi:MAG: hypothetical protein FJW31_02725 [Acidobacteria bacterium]|nr:hypothetical protein [Acidobacteriota bacterium]